MKKIFLYLQTIIISILPDEFADLFSELNETKFVEMKMPLTTKMEMLSGRLDQTDICDLYNSVITKNKKIWIVEVYIRNYNFYPYCFKIGPLLKTMFDNIADVQYKEYIVSCNKQSLSSGTFIRLKNKINKLF